MAPVCKALTKLFGIVVIGLGAVVAALIRLEAPDSGLFELFAMGQALVFSIFGILIFDTD